MGEEEEKQDKDGKGNRRKIQNGVDQKMGGNCEI